MGRVAALLFAAAAVVTVVGLLLPHQRVDEGGLVAIAAAATAIAAICALGGERLPDWAYGVVCFCGTLVVSVSLYCNGERYGGGAGNDEMFYLWVALFAAYYFGRAMTALQIGLIAVAYALTLVAIDPGPVGPSRWVSTTGLIVGAAVVVRLLSECIGVLLDELRAAARTDHLTGLPNRRAFEDAIEQELARTARGGEGFVVLIGDLDAFKSVNDRFGHQAGDRVLVDAGRTLEREARRGDLVARLGGDEFALLLPRTDMDGALELGERLAHALCERSSDLGFTVGLSTGAAAYGSDGRTLDELLRVADDRLYAEKRNRPQARRTPRRPTAPSAPIT
jgi:diguanylate cyclase (GGDEF)-like protein